MPDRQSISSIPFSWPHKAIREQFEYGHCIHSDERSHFVDIASLSSFLIYPSSVSFISLPLPPLKALTIYHFFITMTALSLRRETRNRFQYSYFISIFGLSEELGVQLCALSGQTDPLVFKFQVPTSLAVLSHF